MTYLPPPGADDPRYPGHEGAVPPPDPMYPPAQAYPPQPDPLYPTPTSGYPSPSYLPGYPYQPSPYQQPYAYPYPPMGYPAAQPTDGMAIAALVVSCVSVLGLCGYGVGGLLGIVGAVLGHVARGRIRRTGDQGDGMALAGIIVGWIATGVGILLLAVFIVFFILAAGDASAAA